MPLLPLDTFRQLLGYNPWHFWGWEHQTLVQVTSQCQTWLREYPWQFADRPSRSDVRTAIEAAERKLREGLGYSVAPHYVEEADLQFPRPGARGMQYAAPIGAGGRWLSVRLREGLIRAVGVESLTVIDDAVAVTRSSLVSQTLKESFSLSCTVPSGTTADQVAVYFAAADRFDGSDASDRWRVQPVKVRISGTTATITGPAWLLAKPALYEVQTAALDPTTDSNYVTTLDVYRRRTNGDGTATTNAQGVLTWETPPYGGAGCPCGSSTDSSTDPAAIATAIARVGIRDARRGWVAPGEAAYNSDTSTWYTAPWDSCRQPDRVTIRYLAGLPLIDQQMDPQWRDVVAHLAAAELPRPGQGCDTANHWLSYWQFDLARASGANDETYGLSAEAINNPFGSRRGQVEAWRRVANGDHIRRGTLG